MFNLLLQFGVYRQLNIKKPFLDVRVFKSQRFTIGVIGSMMLYFVMMGFTVLQPIYLQTICNHSATASGVVKLPGSIVMSAVSLFAGKLFDRFGMKKIFVSGAIILLICNIWLSLMTETTALWIMGALNVLYGIATGFPMMPLVTWGVSALNSNLTAHGTALVNSLRTVAGSVGTAIFVGIMTLVSNRPEGSTGEISLLNGYNAACLTMAVCSFFLLLIAIFLVKKQTPRILKPDVD